MGFADAIQTCFRKYVTFSGRAPRAEFWWFFLFLLLGSFVTGFLDQMLFGAARLEPYAGHGAYGFRAASNGPFSLLFSLGTVLPSFAVGWRRMHDTGRSGLYLLYPLIAMAGIFTFASFIGVSPMLGVDASGLVAVILWIAIVVFFLSPFIVLWWLTRPSQPGSNQYGPNPHEVTP